MATQNLACDELWQQFPTNMYVLRLLQRARAMHIKLAHSPVPEQWLYHPAHRTIYVWTPDLGAQSLSYLVVILAHELGHAIDFDRHPDHAKLTRNLHWSAVPSFLERNAFVNGFVLLKELQIPVSLDHYAAMIDDDMAEQVVAEIERHHLCCLLSTPKDHSSDASPARSLRKALTAAAQ